MSGIRNKGFTIVELLIVIVIIGVLAAIVVVAYNGVQARSKTVQREADAGALLKAIHAARSAKGVPLMNITNSTYSVGNCIGTNNSSNTVPKDLPKTHTCWTRYYANLDALAAATGFNLNGLRGGDINGNPYMWDENEGEGTVGSTPAPECKVDTPIVYFTGNGISRADIVSIPKYYAPC